MRISELARSETWAIKPEALAELCASSEQQLEERAARSRVRLPRVDGSVAVIPVHDVISHRAEFGGVSTMQLEAAFSRAMNSDRISAIVLDIDSPGGTVPGVQAASDRIFAARGIKPVVSVANSLAASAAYWIGTAADKMFGAPGSEVGSVGVFRMHADFSEAMAQDGIKVNFLSVPEFKTEANPYEPLSDAARAHHMEQVNETYEHFKGAVAKHRGLSAAVAHKSFGKGRTFHPEEATSRGMIDDVKGLDQVLREFGVGVGRASLTAAESGVLQDEIRHSWETGEIDERPWGAAKILNATDENGGPAWCIVRPDDEPQEGPAYTNNGTNAKAKTIIAKRIMEGLK